MLTIWGGVEENFGAYISLAAYIQGPIVGITLVDYLLIRRDRFSLEDAYYLKGHDAYCYPGGINPVGMGCIVIACILAMCFVYNPLNGQIHNDIFYLTTGSGFTVLSSGVLYWLANRVLMNK